jgi:hypothetical protein
MVRALDKKRLREMEREMTDCWADRYFGDLPNFYDENPDAANLSEKLFAYLDGRTESAELPTYYHYWEDEESRRRLWCIERDPIALGMMHKLDREARDIIDGKNLRRAKRVGDGSHIPIAENAQADQAPLDSRPPQD